MNPMPAAHWGVYLLALLLLVLGVGHPTARVLKRMGYSPGWTPVAFIPYVNVIALWVLAFRRWPSERS